jgi:hypothetical protein
VWCGVHVHGKHPCKARERACARRAYVQGPAEHPQTCIHSNLPRGSPGEGGLGMHAPERACQASCQERSRKQCTTHSSTLSHKRNQVAASWSHFLTNLTPNLHRQVAAGVSSQFPPLQTPLLLQQRASEWLHCTATQCHSLHITKARWVQLAAALTAIRPATRHHP